jgi:FlaA1/EpsC-like NDP-sugar epimerase
VQIEDLLNRVPINIKNSKISKQLKDQVIFVTGGAGSIGSEIVRQIVNYDYKSLIIIDQAESPLYDLQQELKQNDIHNFIPIVSDIRDKNRMNTIFQEYRPNIVFHAAAYKHVPLMEYNSYEAIKINVAGTKMLVDLASTYNVDKFVFVSTDKAVNPTNVMGATKRIAEMYISCKHQESNTRFITTRFGNVLGSNGSVIPLFKKQIDKGGPLTVTHKDITRYFMTIPEASQLVLEAAAMGRGGEIFIFDMGKSVKIFDLAKNMIKLSGLRYPEDIDIKITGLRPGEKLYEELLASGESTLPTYHKKIMISKVRDLDYADVRSKIDELCVSNMFFNSDTVSLMKKIVPEYVSNNSEFCELDKKESEDNNYSKEAQVGNKEEKKIVQS